MWPRYTLTEWIDRDRCHARARSSDGRERDVTIMRLPRIMRGGFAKLLMADLRPALSLRHPNIVEVLDIEKADDTYFVVTEHVAGCDLRTFVARRRRLAHHHVLHVMIECCKALAHAHSHELVHRRLAPRTLELSVTGDVKLGDFGLTRIRVLDTEPSPDKFSYLSPEATHGPDVDARADVFGAGTVLWELLAGRRLFLGETNLSGMSLIRTADVPRIEGLDPSLDAIARQALALDVGARYQTAAELGDALTRYQISRSIPISPAQLGPLVRGVLVELQREPFVDRGPIATMQAEVDRMTSIVDAAPN